MTKRPEVEGASLAARNGKSVADFMKRVDKAVVDGLAAGHAALQAGNSLKDANQVFCFVRDARLAEALLLLPRFPFDAEEFDKLPIVKLGGGVTPEGWARYLFAGCWLVALSGGGGSLFYRPEIEGGMASYNN